MTWAVTVVTNVFLLNYGLIVLKINEIFLSQCCKWHFYYSIPHYSCKQFFFMTIM